MRGRFHPQAWVNDYAIEVDPEGPTDWTLTPEYFKSLVEAKGSDVLEPADTYESDELRFDPAAPEWTRDWQGPFYVEVQP